MIDFILKYWIQELFALILAVLTWLWQTLLRRKQENDEIKEGMMALLHDRIYQACSFFIARGWCSPEDRSNLEYLYKPYKELGGKSLYKKCLELPLTADRNKKKEE